MAAAATTEPLAGAGLADGRPSTPGPSRPQTAERRLAKARAVGAVLVSLLMALPEELLVRPCSASNARDLVSLSESCTALRCTMQRIVEVLIMNLHGVRWTQGPLPRLRQLHVLELITTLRTSTMVVFQKPMVVSKSMPGRYQPPWKVVEGALLLPPSGGPLPDGKARVASMSCGRDHLVFLDSSGRAWCLGDARAGGVPHPGAALPRPGCGGEGAGEALHSADGVSLDGSGGVKIERPVQVEALADVKLIKVACGNGHNIAMTATGDVFTWGKVLDGDSSSPFHGESSGWRLPDVTSGLPGEALDVAAGDAHVAVVSLTGDTYAWGQNYHGQCACNPCGGGLSADGSWFALPRRVVGEALEKVVSRGVACGRYHTVILSTEGDVFTFGAGLSGQLGRPVGNGSSSAVRAGSSVAQCPWEPAKVPFQDIIPPGGGKADATTTNATIFVVVQVACGEEHTMCLTDSGRVFGFGSSEFGQLGQGTVKSRRSPAEVSRALGRVRELTAGGRWTMLRCASGKVFLAGREESDKGGDDCRLLKEIIAPRWA